MEEDTKATSASDGLLIAPITALTFVENLLLAGEGPTLKLYVTSKSTKNLLTSIHLFKATNIHGITVAPSKGVNSYLLAIHGGKSCCIVELDTVSTTVNVLQHHEFSDWILATTWLQNQDGTHLTLATAHNCVIRWDWKEQALLETVHCQEKCILYSALLIGDRWEHLVLAGGTVFNQVVIWEVGGKQDERGRREVLHRLAGHQGVIFSMTFNPRDQLLCSVSDDRSIRVWRVDTGQSPSGGQDVGQLSWTSAQFVLVHVLYGHTARVWDARYLGNNLVSIGEDSTCCIWNAEGRVIQRLKGHRGKSIWSLAVSEDAQLIATGGGDAGIRLWTLTDQGADPCPLHLSKLNPPPALVGEGAKLAPKVTRLMNKDTVLIMTDTGALFQFKSDTSEWSLLVSDVRYQSYGLLTVSPNGTKVVVGSLSGHVKVIAHGKIIETHCHDGKVFSLVWLADDRFITTGPEGKMVVWRVADDLSLEQLTTFTLPAAKQRWVSAAVLLTDRELVVCGDRVGSVHLYDLSQQDGTGSIQSFWKVHGKAGVTDVRYHDNHVYSAGRDGEYREYDVIEGRLELLHSNKVLKGLEWIAQIRFTEGDMHVLGFYTDQFIVHSVGTNQTLLSLPCGGGHRAWDFTLEETGDVTFVYIKAGAVEMCRSLLKSSHTLVKPSLHGREVTDVKLITTHMDSHGSFSVVATSSEDTRINLVGLKCCRGSSPEYHILATLQGHISSVRTLATSSSHKNCPPLSEKTANSCDTQTLPSENSIAEHPSVILFSGGGRAQLKAWRVSMTHKKTHPNNPSTCPDQNSASASRDETNSTEFGTCSDKDPQVFPLDVQYEHLSTYNLHEKGRRNRKPWRKMTFDPSPETRYMALSAIPLTQIRPDGDSNIHILAAACSDGFVRLLCFREDVRSFSVMAQSDYHGHCVLTTRLVTVNGTSGQSLPWVYMFSAATDGRVSVWEVTTLVHSYTHCLTAHCPHKTQEDAASTQPCLTYLTSDLLTPDLVVDAHQSGVNAMDIYRLKGDEYLLATGGDDNCLTVHRLSFSERDGQHVVSVTGSGRNSTAHAAQINGVFIVDERTVKSVSIDQRMATWTITQDLELTQTSCQFTHVSDVSQMENWRGGGGFHSVVTGMGLEYVIS